MNSVELLKSYQGLADKVNALLEKTEFGYMAIDGRCASGKSTLGEALREVYAARLLHMDDFYVPFAQKTPERLSEPGGNADYERFSCEVLSLPKGAPIPYRRFDSVSQTLLPAEILAPARLTVVEGSYALHRALRGAYDLKVFLSIDPKLQRARILKRNGAEKLKQFEALWIPLEEAYFAAEGIESMCDLRYAMRQ